MSTGHLLASYSSLTDGMYVRGLPVCTSTTRDWGSRSPKTTPP